MPTPLTSSQRRSKEFWGKKPTTRKINLEEMVFAKLRDQELEMKKEMKKEMKRLIKNEMKKRFTSSAESPDTLLAEVEDANRGGKSRGGGKGTNKAHLTCEVCEAHFRKASYLTQHMQGHSDERPFSCQECNREFLRKDHLVRHLLTHKGDRFACPVCEKTFTYKGNVNKHLKKKHSQNSQDKLEKRIIGCTYEGCTHTFLNTSNMKKHMRIHKKKNHKIHEMYDVDDPSSQQVAVKQQKLENEVNCLKSELHQVREHQLALVEILSPDIMFCSDLSSKVSKEIAALMATFTALEDKRRQHIKALELALTNEKLKSAEQKKLIQDLQSRVADAENQIVDGENLRKRLQNTILELKGNIRVFCRVRPAIPDSDSNDTEGPVISYPTSTEALGRGIDLMHHAQKYSFTFDKVFTHDSSQETVFVEVSELVQSALDGYKVCIFAYGQTGSGKTYTMMGEPEIHERKGLIPRSLEQIFEIIQSRQTQGWKYKIKASMLEIYNENIRDLLSTNRPDSLEAFSPSKKYSITHDNGNTHVSDLTIVDVCSITKVYDLLQQANKNRSVGRTQMNEQSSRSHSVFTLRISGVNESTEQKVQGVLNLIDLAGSERLARSGAMGCRLKETQAINKSLSSLCDVIVAIAKKEDHVPYRNSKLTYILQPCLGGDSKTLMFVNVSPEASSAGESLNSLRFAARVNSCEIGVPRRHIQMRSVDETRTPHSKPPKNKAACHRGQ